MIVDIARVSTNKPAGEPGEKLLRYLIEHKHWSPFEMASMCVSIRTTIPIATQILRHRSFSFQQFSQRYSQVQEVFQITPRRQDMKNRQNSFDDLSEETKTWFADSQNQLLALSHSLYQEAIDKGVAKESARFLLTQSTSTFMYMSGTIRSFIHYLQIRDHVGTQLEHREVAQQVKAIFCKELPTIALALGW